MTQEALGTRAGYKGGASVTISRIEKGALTPSPPRLEGIAAALGVSIEGLNDLAKQQVLDLARRAEREPPTLDDRIARVRTAAARYEELDEAYSAFTVARNQAETNFLSSLRQLASRIDGIPSEGTAGTGLTWGEPTADPEITAQDQLHFTHSGVCKVLAKMPRIETTEKSDYYSFSDNVAASAFAGVSAAMPMAAASSTLLPAAFRWAYGLRQDAAERLTNAVITGAAIAATLLAIRSNSAARRTKRQRDELEAALNKIEPLIVEAQPSLEALAELLPRATDVLNYIATHAGHALARWGRVIPPGQTEWGSLKDKDRHAYEKFAEIAAAQLAVATIDFSALTDARNDDLRQAAALAREVIKHSNQLVTEHV